MGRVSFGAVLLLLALLQRNGMALCRALPSEVKGAIAEAAKQCDGHVVQETGYVKRVFVFRRPAYILDYYHFACYRNGKRGVDWCGSAGCQLQVVTKMKGVKYSKTEVNNAIDFHFR